MQPILSAIGLSFEFPNGLRLFENLCFSIDSQLTALVGPNGTGKTTLAQLIAGEWEPTRGSIARRRAVYYLKQRVARPEGTVEEFCQTPEETPEDWSPLRHALLLKIDARTKCTSLSGGEWMRVRLAALPENAFLILDEPTNDLDRPGRELIREFLQKHRGGALLISHDRECLELCTDILELSSKGLMKFGDGWRGYEEAKERERASAQKSLEKARRERKNVRERQDEKMRRQEKRNRKGVQEAATGSLPKILLGARKRNAEKTTGKIHASALLQSELAVRNAAEAYRELKVEPIMYAEVLGKPVPAQKLLLEARDFNVRLDRRSDRRSGRRFDQWLYKKDLSFAWRGNIRLALKGPNGSGKSTLLKALNGDAFLTRGEIRKGSLTTFYLDQSCSGLEESKSIFENIRDVSTLTESEIRGILAEFLFTREQVFQTVGSLSGGERLRAALAKGLMSSSQPELLILDEPTNNLDLLNIQFIERLVCEFRGAVIVISHDERFLTNCRLLEVFDLGQ